MGELLSILLGLLLVISVPVGAIAILVGMIMAIVLVVRWMERLDSGKNY